ncbi:carbohydrate esterase family 4 protein [Stipitochalara longipes BDJ]|nr:carbohydrate esterase family 4 protein [Stipitochalara longipes BDJ]
MFRPFKNLLRARRAFLTYLWTTSYNLISGTNTPKKHIKIDDEERQLSSDGPYSQHSHLPRLLRMLLLILLTLLLILFLLAYTIYKPPFFIISFFQWKYPSVLFHLPLPSSQKLIALTIDDAPSPYTSQILDLLKEYNAKATFFIIGSQISSHPSILARIHAEGHETGSHAWHDEASLSLPLTELKVQIQELDELLPGNENGEKYFRPGSGFFSKGMVEMVRGLGYRTVLGSVYPHDPQIHSARWNSRHVLSMVKPGAVVIVHDRRGYSVEEVERILKGLKEGGWKVESLGGLLRIAEEERVRMGG